MNAIEILESEHKGAMAAMDAVLRSAGEARKALFNALKAELELHDNIEETVFYPALAAHPAAAGFQGADKSAHEAVEAELDRLSAISVEDRRWEAAFKSMQVALLGHIHDEESGVFMKAKEGMSESELIDLGLAMKAKKDQHLRLVGSKP